MLSKRRVRPLLITAIIMVMLALAWLPTGDLTPEQRSNKPHLFVNYDLPSSASNQAKDVVFDIQQRIEQRHEWKLLQEPADYAWQLKVTLIMEQQVELVGELRAPHAEQQTAQSLQRFKIQGDASVVGVLPGQYVKVLIELIESGQSMQSSL